MSVQQVKPPVPHLLWVVQRPSGSEHTFTSRVEAEAWIAGVWGGDKSDLRLLSYALAAE